MQEYFDSLDYDSLSAVDEDGNAKGKIDYIIYFVSKFLSFVYDFVMMATA